MSVRSICFTVLLAPVSLFRLCLDDLSVGESGVLKSPTIKVCWSVCDLSFNVYFTNMCVLAFGA